MGLSPDVIICRSSTRVEESTREKISVFCHVRPSHVLSVHDVSNIYHVPIILAEQNLHGILRCVRALLRNELIELVGSGRFCRSVGPVCCPPCSLDGENGSTHSCSQPASTGPSLTSAHTST